MDSKIIRKMLKEEENALLDFKSIFFDINDSKSKMDFVKDILSFSNSTINNNAYIICGVKEDGTGNKEILGVHANTHIDDARWVQLLSSYSSHPINFSIRKVKLDIENVSIIIIEISKDQKRPVFCAKDHGEKLKKGNIYYRNGSTNDIAKDLVTVERIIQKTQQIGENNPQSDPTYNRYSKFPPAPYYEFFGREDELVEVFNDLINHHKNYLLSLVGDGGVGKTSIAYKVAERVKNDIEEGVSEFDDVIWISAKDQRIYFDERRELEREFNSIEDLYNKILLIFHDFNFLIKTSFAEKLKLVNEALNGTSFLFVLDNLEVFSNEEIKRINDFVKNAPNGHKFLFTSRHDLRVQEIVSVSSFGKETTEVYVDNIIQELNKNISGKINEIEIQQLFDSFYKLTNGNPLYIKFFLSQMYKGRPLTEILSRRNVDSEKPLKAYCFDSTLEELESDEIIMMYSLAISEASYLSLNELICVTNLERNHIQNLLEQLVARSMIYKEFNKGQQVYILNSLLKNYLIEEKRIPGAEQVRLTQKTRLFDIYNKDINEDYAFNFGLKTVINKNEIMSFNMSIDLLNSNELITDSIDVIPKLYSGNYMLPLYTILRKISNRRRVTDFHIYNEINTAFVQASANTSYKELKTMLSVWKCILYMRIEKYDDVIQEIEYINKSENTHQNLLLVLKASALSSQAKEEFNKQRFKKHDDYREESNMIFGENLQEFMKKPYFFFIKNNIIKHYRYNTNHLKQSLELDTKDYSPFIPDFDMVNRFSF
ncbi:RNA-binding domain-containing protein [Paenibacillus wenxiniae]|uniref:RNA-binding domain-containing protein n=1 Tax=Paenibacillus wenxiniae TaxID=1636843 RepID=A0ABW4RE24_9BACL